MDQKTRSENLLRHMLSNGAITILDYYALCHQKAQDVQKLIEEKRWEGDLRQQVLDIIFSCENVDAAIIVADYNGLLPKGHPKTAAALAFDDIDPKISINNALYFILCNITCYSFIRKAERDRRPILCNPSTLNGNLRDTRLQPTSVESLMNLLSHGAESLKGRETVTLDVLIPYSSLSFHHFTKRIYITCHWDVDALNYLFDFWVLVDDRLLLQNEMAGQIYRRRSSLPPQDRHVNILNYVDLAHEFKEAKFLNFNQFVRFYQAYVKIVGQQLDVNYFKEGRGGGEGDTCHPINFMAVTSIFDGSIMRTVELPTIHRKANSYFNGHEFVCDVAIEQVVPEIRSPMDPGDLTRVMFEQIHDTKKGIRNTSVWCNSLWFDMLHDRTNPYNPLINYYYHAYLHTTKQIFMVDGGLIFRDIESFIDGVTVPLDLVRRQHPAGEFVGLNVSQVMHALGARIGVRSNVIGQFLVFVLHIDPKTGTMTQSSWQLKSYGAPGDEANSGFSYTQLTDNTPKIDMLDTLVEIQEKPISTQVIILSPATTEDNIVYAIVEKTFDGEYRI